MNDLQQEENGFHHGSQRHNPHLHTHAIVGSSFTGISCYRTLKKLVMSSSLAGNISHAGADIASTIVLEKGHVLGSRSPLNNISGANILSFNMDESSTQQGLRRLEDKTNPIIQLIDDGLLSHGMLSKTSERPTGWNRGTGQWQHYTKRKQLKDILSSLLTSNQGDVGDYIIDAEDIVCNKNVASIEYVLERECWRIKTNSSDDMIDNSTEYFDSQALILAISPEDALSILQASHSSLSTVVKATDFNIVLTVLQSACNRRITRYATSIKIKRNSGFGAMVEAKFKEHYCNSASSTTSLQNGGVHELDVSQINSRDITLITKIIDPKNDGKEGIEEEDKGIDLHLSIHALRREVLESKDALLEWFLRWTGLPSESTIDSYSNDLTFDSEHISLFHQAPMGVIAPLSPLRETGYIMLSEKPIMVLAGDYCINPPCVSSALLSGEKAAKAIVNLQLQSK